MRLIAAAFFFVSFGTQAFADGACPSEYVELATTPTMSSYPPAVKSFQTLAYPKSAKLIIVGDSHVGYLELGGGPYGKFGEALKIFGAGDRPQNTLWRLDDKRIDMSRYKPEYVVFMLGTNAGGYPPCAVLAGIGKVLESARSFWPAAKFLYVPLLPRGVFFDDDNKSRKEINEGLDLLLLRYGGRVVEIDENKITCGNSGKLFERKSDMKDMCVPVAERPQCIYYQNDHTHLTDQGYLLIRESVFRYLH